MTFEELGLKSEVLKSLQELVFEAPTPIQEKAIPYLLGENSDFVGDAPIKVGNTTYGSLLKQSSGMVSAKFNDNFIIVL